MPFSKSNPSRRKSPRLMRPLPVLPLPTRMAQRQRPTRSLISFCSVSLSEVTRSCIRKEEAIAKFARDPVCTVRFMFFFYLGCEVFELKKKGRETYRNAKMHLGPRGPCSPQILRLLLRILLHLLVRLGGNLRSRDLLLQRRLSSRAVGGVLGTESLLRLCRLVTRPGYRLDGPFHVRPRGLDVEDP